jgi:response regulator RpfG family c-di-GMP phosphodiesterase
MPLSKLAGRHILIVEDECVVSMEMEMALRAEGADVIGPEASVESALRILESQQPVDLAVIDINLRGEPAYPIVAALKRRKVPFLIATGYSASEIAPEHADVPYLGKPVSMSKVTAALTQLVPRA